MEERHARRFVLEVQQVELLRELAMIVAFHGSLRVCVGLSPARTEQATTAPVQAGRVRRSLRYAFTAACTRPPSRQCGW